MYKILWNNNINYLFSCYQWMQLQNRLYDSYPEWNFILVRTYMQHNYFFGSKFSDKQMYLSNRVCFGYAGYNNSGLNSATLLGLGYEFRELEHGERADYCVPRSHPDLQRVRLILGRHISPTFQRSRVGGRKKWRLLRPRLQDLLRIHGCLPNVHA